MKKLFTVALLLAVAAYMSRSGVLKKAATGDFELDGNVISYERVTPSEGRLELFGNVYKINLDVVAKIGSKTEQLYDYSKKVLPEFISGAGKIIMGETG